MRYVVVDLEATCWKGVRDFNRMETIEIGAVELATSAGPFPGREFASFVQPVAEPTLSEFCTSLTTIRQQDVAGAPTFPEAFRRFRDWIGPAPFVLCSWGGYDLTQFRVDCARHGMPLPEAFERHVNLKKEYARVRGVKPCGMATAVTQMGWPLAGTHHRGIDDARNIARLGAIVLPILEDQGAIPSMEGSRPS